MKDSVITSLPSKSTILFDYQRASGDGEIGNMFLNAALVDLIHRLNDGYCVTLIEPCSITLCRSPNTLEYTGRKPDILAMAIMIGFCQRLGFQRQKMPVSEAASDQMRVLINGWGEMIISLSADFSMRLGLPNLIRAAENILMLAAITTMSTEEIKRTVSEQCRDNIYRQNLHSFLDDSGTRGVVAATTLKP
jgi:hypothetical protein